MFSPEDKFSWILSSSVQYTRLVWHVLQNFMKMSKDLWLFHSKKYAFSRCTGALNRKIMNYVVTHKQWTNISSNLIWGYYLLLASGGLPEAYPRCLPVKILALRILLFLSHSLFICGTWRINKIWCCTANITGILFDIDIFLWFFFVKGFSPFS